MNHHETSFERLLSGATLSGMLSAAGGEESRAAAVLVQRLERTDAPHEWLLHVVVTPGGNGVECQVKCDVHWAGSTPVATVHEAEIPGIGTVNAKVLFHNCLFTGTWLHAGRKGQMWGEVVTCAPDETPPKRFVIERSSEYLREWWTGSDWSEDYARARWFEHEPDGPRVTDDEEAHAVCYASGKVEAG